MFSSFFEDKQYDLWNQCADELRKVNPNAGIEEVNRLVVYVSHEVKGSFALVIHEAAIDAINGFNNKLPEAKPNEKKKRRKKAHATLSRK